MSRQPRQAILSTNRKAWNARTKFHVDSDFYGVQRFLAGATTLHEVELSLLGDLRERKILHLQCHFGLDTLSLARRGARPTGVDLSDTAISQARELSARTGIAAEFLCADVQTLGSRYARVFDIVFASYGVLCWLFDLDGWARGIRASLRAGGRFVLVEFHPFLNLTHQGWISGSRSYFGEEDVGAQSSAGTYADQNAPIEYLEYRYQHSLGAVISSLVGNGLMLRDFHEYPFCSYRISSELDVHENGRWRRSDGEDTPYMYSLLAERADEQSNR